MTTRMCTLLVAIAAFPSIALASEASSAHPSALGQWVLNLQKSDFGKLPAPKSGQLTVTEDADKLSWTYRGEDEKGAPVTVSFRGAYDGKPYPVTGASKPTTASYSRNADGTTTETWTEAGDTSHGTISLSADGKTLTNKSSGTDDSGNAITWTTVYDKK